MSTDTDTITEHISSLIDMPLRIEVVERDKTFLYFELLDHEDSRKFRGKLNIWDNEVTLW